MIGTQDFLHFPCTPDLIQGGIAWTLRGLAHAVGDLQIDRLRRRVAAGAAELAFRRRLSRHEIPYEVAPAASFTDPDRYEVIVNGRRCTIFTYLIPDRDGGPGRILDAPALVPSDRHAGEVRAEADLYLFAFLIESLHAPVRGRPPYWIHCMGVRWRRPRNWIPLAPLELKSESRRSLSIDLHGQGGDGGHMTRTIALPPGGRVELSDPFHALSCLHLHGPADAGVSIRSAIFREALRIEPAEWSDLWVHGIEILMAGYLPRGEYRRRASFLSPGARVLQFAHTGVKNLAVPVSGLRPMSELFSRASSPREGG